MIPPRSFHRRELIAASAGVAAFIAGCSGAVGQTSEKKHQITVNNGTQKSHTVTVVIEDESGTVLLDHTFQMEPRTGDAEVAFTGTAATVTVHIDGDVTKEFPWSPEETTWDNRWPNGCSENTSEALELIIDGPDFADDAPDDDEGDFKRTFRCTTPDPSL